MNREIVNLILAIVLSLAIILGWQFFYERPRIDKLANKHQEYQQQIKEVALINRDQIGVQSRRAAIANASRVVINTPSLSGSISLKGLRFDDLVLIKYQQDVDPNSPKVVLFSPSLTKEAYFAEIGWRDLTQAFDFPNAETIWSADNLNLTPQNPVKLTWHNSKNIKFEVEISIDENYMFNVSQRVINHSGQILKLQTYSLINRNHQQLEKSVNILHQGLIGAIDDKLEEATYEHLKDKKTKQFNNAKVSWLGITDKYWLAAFIPDAKDHYSVHFNYAIKNDFDKYQIDYVSPDHEVLPGEELVTQSKLFAGAKKVDLLDKYEKQYNIKLFDRAIDFGWFYILTKPIFHILNFFYKYCGNFGLSILIVTVMIKLALFSLASRSYKSMKRLKDLQPQIDRLKKLHADDPTKLNQSIMDLYKKEKANPLTGCLPIFIQLPVFFSLYKVLYVTIEMRHAPFFGWIKDLSMPDPTSIFNLFGLLAFTPPSFLQIGAWPILMAITMFLQQRLSPAPADPVQAQVIKLMPLVFLFMFSSFPAGLLIYWTWNNILSIIQQTYINAQEK